MKLSNPDLLLLIACSALLVMLLPAACLADNAARGALLTGGSIPDGELVNDETLPPPGTLGVRAGGVGRGTRDALLTGGSIPDGEIVNDNGLPPGPLAASAGGSAGAVIGRVSSSSSVTESTGTALGLLTTGTVAVCGGSLTLTAAPLGMAQEQAVLSWEMTTDTDARIMATPTLDGVTIHAGSVPGVVRLRVDLGGAVSRTVLIPVVPSPQVPAADTWLDRLFPIDEPASLDDVDESDAEQSAESHQ